MQSLEGALADVAKVDPDLVERARTAWDWLTGGQGPRSVTQWRLQQFCWVELARTAPAPLHSADADRPHGSWETAQALATLLDAMGLARYAEIARGEVTAQVLAGGPNTPARGRTIASRAIERSGIEPPNSELLTWSSVPGPAEARAQELVADSLELAIVAGELTPGSRGWREQQAAIALSVLTSPRRDVRDAQGRERAPYDLVLDERLHSWVRRPRSTTRRGLLSPLVPRLREPVDPGMAAPARQLLRPVDWLLTEVGDGLTLTAAGYLPPRVVSRALDQLEWRDALMGPVTREIDAMPVTILRELCVRMGLVRRRGTQLVNTRLGAWAVQDGRALWGAVAAGLIGPDASPQALAWEIVLALLAGGDPVSADDARGLVQAVLTESGLRGGFGRVAAEQDARPLFLAVLRDLRWLGLLEETGDLLERQVRAREGAEDLFRAALRHRVLQRNLGPDAAPGAE